ncbi:hypothetical protein M5689_002946 [Euphorbia peplus]|nr:hypothetical protein M5689_002946 [Euphorbia peplus]
MGLICSSCGTHTKLYSRVTALPFANVPRLAWHCLLNMHTLRSNIDTAIMGVVSQNPAGTFLKALTLLIPDSMLAAEHETLALLARS